MKINNDLINGLFEIGSGIFQIINIVKLIKDKELKDISWIPMGFFTLWGCWNLYYYPSLNQPLSFIGGIMIFVTNFIWLTLVFYYNLKNKEKFQWKK